MAKSVFTEQLQPSYDDDPGNRYHFPSQYLPQVQRSLGDFIVYYQPGRGGKGLGRVGQSAYVASAQVIGIDGDPARSDHFYARLDHYLEFTRPVPFRQGSQTFERRLTKADGQTNRGLFGWSVREIADDEFEAIVAAGFGDLQELEHGALSPDASFPPGLSEPAANFERPIVEALVRRRFREAAFALNVKRAYGGRCLFTGLRLINGGGNAEIDAAHIRPVGSGHNGTDSVRNGLALSKTAHWLFDRGLVSLDQDLELVVARDEIPQDAMRLFAPDVKARLPKDPKLLPFADFLAYHREEICAKRGHRLVRVS